MGKKQRSQGYIISVRGPLPINLVERISELRALVILHRLSKTPIDQPESTDHHDPLAPGYSELDQRSHQDRQAEIPAAPTNQG